jgi:hypothetical protein
MTEKDTDKALLVVRITNENRLNADVTEDFFLIPVSKFGVAVKSVRDLQVKSNATFTVNDVMRKLNENKIDYEHVIEGTRIFLGLPDEDEDAE